jgi:hypothetical protein
MFRKIETLTYIASKSWCRRWYLRLAAGFTETACAEPGPIMIPVMVIMAPLAPWAARFAYCLGVN